MWYAIVAILILIADQGLKYWVTLNIPLDTGHVTLIPGVLLNVMNQPFDAYALSEDELAKWDQLIRVRTDVNGVLEAARAEKRIGKPLEAAVTLRADDDAARAALDDVQSMNLPELLIVSQCLVGGDVPADAVTGTGTNFPGLHISVRNAPGTKCPRCWMHSEQADPETGLCPRCAAVVAAQKAE